MIDPEAFEQALSDELSSRLPEWSAAPTSYEQASPRTIIVRYDGADIDNEIHGRDPRRAVASAKMAQLRLRARFISARQAARGVFAGLLEVAIAACRALTEARQQLWLVESQQPIEVKAEGEAPVKSLDVFIRVDLVLA